MLKSQSNQYGSMAVSLHWLTAILVLALLISGSRAADTTDLADKAAILRLHVPMAITLLVLTIIRIVWWWRFDNKPLPVQGSPVWQERIARAVHVIFYIVILGMIASGIGMVALSGAGPAIFGEPGATLPNFHDYLPRTPHGVGATVLLGLVVLHIAGALYHQFVRRDGLLARMWYRR